MLTRRSMMGVTTSALLLAACSGDEAAKDAMTDTVSYKRKAGQPKVGIQTYTIRDAMEEDTQAALQMLKDVGYDFLETNERDYSRIPMADLKQAIDAVGLPVVSTHIGSEAVAPGGDLQSGIDAAKALGAEYAVLSWTPEQYRSTEGYKTMAARFNEVGEAMLAEGIRFGYHNHHFEFWEIDGPRSGMDIYLEETDPAKVWFELDMFWTALGDADPIALFRAHPGRFKLCHIKDMNKAGLVNYTKGDLDFGSIHKGLMVNVGEGDLDFESWLKMSDISGIEHLITEHDAPPAPLRDSVAMSLKTVRGYNL